MKKHFQIECMMKESFENKLEDCLGAQVDFGTLWGFLFNNLENELSLTLFHGTKDLLQLNMRGL